MKIDQIVLDILAGLLTEGETVVIEEAVKVVKAQGGGGKPAKIFSHNAMSAEDRAFQIYPCTQSPSGDGVFF